MPNALVIGATGFVGGGIARHLAASGWSVGGLARSAIAVARLESSGIDAVAGDVERHLDAVVAASQEYDVIIYAAQVAPPVELAAVSGLISGLAGSGRTFVFLSGSGVLCQRTAGAWSAESFAEEDVFLPEQLAKPRVEAERLVRAASSNGLRAMVVRPPLIWGPGDHGHVPMVYRSVSTTGGACYVGSGLATYGHIHIDDVAALFQRAIEAGKSGALYQGVAGEVPNRWIAEAVARDLGVSSRSVSMEEAAKVWGEFGALIMSVSSRVRDAATRAALGWAPRHADLLSAIGDPRLRALASSITTKE